MRHFALDNLSLLEFWLLRAVRRRDVLADDQVLLLHNLLLQVRLVRGLLLPLLLLQAVHVGLPCLYLDAVLLRAQAIGVEPLEHLPELNHVVEFDFDAL